MATGNISSKIRCVGFHQWSCGGANVLIFKHWDEVMHMDSLRDIADKTMGRKPTRQCCYHVIPWDMTSNMIWMCPRFGDGSMKYGMWLWKLDDNNVAQKKKAGASGSKRRYEDHGWWTMMKDDEWWMRRWMSMTCGCIMNHKEMIKLYHMCICIFQCRLLTWLGQPQRIAIQCQEAKHVAPWLQSRNRSSKTKNESFKSLNTETFTQRTFTHRT